VSASGGSRRAAASTSIRPTTSPSSIATRSSSALLPRLHTISTVASTVPGNGDVNPYGVVVVRNSKGKLHAGQLLVSNFNDKSNSQGTGTTIVEISPSGHRSVFAHLRAGHLPGRCPGGVGLTTALDILPGGYVVVGSLPTADGMSATAKAGCLIVFNDRGHPVSTIAGRHVQGPWDSTVVSHGSVSTLFVSMVLNGGAKSGQRVVDNSTVVRFRLKSSPGRAPQVLSQTVVADKIPRRDDPSALVIGPTGLGVSSTGTLYVADTLDNRIAAVRHALTRGTPATDAGRTVSQGGHLEQPLGLALAPNGDILTTNAGDGNIVETTPGGGQVAVTTAESETGAGSLFGLVVAPSGKRVFYVDDGDNTLKVLH